MRAHDEEIIYFMPQETIDTTQFNYIPQFLECLLNLSDTTKILQSDDIFGKFYIDESKEILPDINLPNDLWLRSNINIRDVKIKVTMLTEINLLIDTELHNLSTSMDDTTIVYYQKILTAYKFYETPKHPIKNDIDERDDYEELSKLIHRTISNQSTVSSKTHLSHISHNSQNTGSVSTQSMKRESGLGRRFSSLLNGASSPTSPTTPINGISPLTTTNSSGYNVTNNDHDDDDNRQQVLNSILSKSRLYNRIKKNRESSSLMSSSSNRNSINSFDSKRRNSSIPQDDIAFALSSLSLNQRQEIQRFKFDYYLQVKQLLLHINKIFQFGQSSYNDKPIKLLDFIKRYVFKFIVLDVLEMVKSYGEIEAHTLCSR